MRWSRRIRRNGPLAAMAAAAVFVTGVVVLGDGPGEVASGGEGMGDERGYVVEMSWGRVRLPEGVVPFSIAEERGLDVDWPDTCDTEQGRLAVPLPSPPECYAPFTGDNGGATAPGVTRDTIKVVLYQAIDNDFILDAIVGRVSNDTPTQFTRTYRQLLPYFNEYYETYGREVELIVYQGSGGSTEAEAARADAVDIAERIRPFAVFDGPQLTGAFADELAARGILHIGLLGGSERPEYYAETDPYLFQLGMAPWQSRRHAAEYIGKRLAGRPAEHAGDPALARRERRFGLVYLETGPGADQVREQFQRWLADHGVDLAEYDSYANPLDVQQDAPQIIAKMKEAGVTSLILTGDPRTPETFTAAATDQQYFPEWILAGSPLADTAVYARNYDQQQWAHAFGVSFGAVRRDPSVASAARLFRWYTCSDPPADEGVELTAAIPSLFFGVLQAVGPNLTHRRFRDVLFGADPSPSTPAAASLSWGPPERGRWDEPDYQGVDDATEIWWDPEATGPDEVGAEGAGMYRYVDGGRRYLPGDWPETRPRVFDPAGTVTLHTDPPGEAVRDYPSPCRGGPD